MTTIILTANDEDLKVVTSPTISAGDIDIVKAEFNLSEEWNNLYITAIFYNDVDNIYEVILDNNKCDVPNEVLQSAGTVYIGIKGEGDNGEFKTSTVARQTIVESVPVTRTAKPTPDVYTQLMSYYNKVNVNENILTNIVEYLCNNPYITDEVTNVKYKITARDGKLYFGETEVDFDRLLSYIVTDEYNDLDDMIASKINQYISENSGGFATKEEVSDLENELLTNSINLLNPSNFEEGKLVNKATGSLITLANYNTYTNIPVEPLSDYILQRDNKVYFSITYVFYDKEGAYISGKTSSANNTDMMVISTPDNASTMIISYATSNGTDVFEWQNIMLSKGTEKVAYIPPKLLNEECCFKIYKKLELIYQEMIRLNLHTEEFSQICYGGEFLYGWYKRIIDGENVKVTLMGDSTMAETYLEEEHPSQKKAYYINKMLADRLGDERVKIVNWGVGSTSTGDLVGSHFSNDIIAENFPEGYMASRISSDTNLIVINYGINDYSYNSDMLTYEERLEEFKNNYIEFFSRLYGTESVNGRPALGRTHNDISVILVVPNIVSTDTERYQWAFDCRQVLQEIAKEYHCALFDTLKIDANHKFNGWSIGDDIHPAYYSNAYLMQYMEQLIIPKII